MVNKSLVVYSLLIVFGLLFLFSFSSNSRSIIALNNRTQTPIIHEVIEPDLSIKEGYVSQKKETVIVERKGKKVAKVKLSEPQIIAMAEKEENWGFFQFPGLYRSEKGSLITLWQMNVDSYKSYGRDSTVRMSSSDNGITWKPEETSSIIIGGKIRKISNGNIIQVSTPPAKNIHEYASFPQKVCSDRALKMDFYLESELPDDLQGMYLNVIDAKTKKTTRIHGELDDPGLIRYAIDGQMPIMWWGDIKELSDGSLVGGIYRTYYRNIDKGTPKSCITFYKSKDGGYHWKSIGRIPYKIEEIKDASRHYDSTRGFSEASFEALNDSVFFCVLRTGYNTPMYKTCSYDGGQHWTEPTAFTPNGVYPIMLRLCNGVLVLASGRPGMQLRFCLEGDGNIWTEPIEMLPFLDEKGNYDIWDVTCGYSSLLQVDNNTFFMVYSNFRAKNAEGKFRKAIMFRKIEIILC